MTAPNVVILARYGSTYGNKPYVMLDWAPIDEADEAADDILAEYLCKVAVIPIHIIDLTPEKAHKWVDIGHERLPGDAGDSAWEWVLQGHLGRVDRVIERTHKHEVMDAQRTLAAAEEELQYANDRVAEAARDLWRAESDLDAARARLAQLITSTEAA